MALDVYTKPVHISVMAQGMAQRKRGAAQMTKSNPQIRAGRLAIVSEGGSFWIADVKWLRSEVKRLKGKNAAAEQVEDYKRYLAFWDAYKAGVAA